MKHGKGTWTFSDGSTLTGKFINDSISEGVYRSNNNTEYKGTFKNSLKHGKGVIKYENGRVYEGDFYEDKISGKGKMVVNGKVYEGEFLNGKMHGIGIIKKVGEEKGKKGRWENGKRIEWVKN